MGVAPHQPELDMITFTPSGRGAGRWGDCVPLERCGARRAVLDLQRLGSVGPVVAARVAAWVDLNRHAGAEVGVNTRAPRRARHEWSRWGLFAEGGHRSGSFGSSPSRPLLRVTRLRSAREADELGEALHAQLTRALRDGHGAAVDPVVVAFLELTSNATTHGASVHGTYVAAEHEPRQGLTLVVGDLGTGIPAHLRPHLGGELDDHAVISHALQRGVSSTPGGGDGLACLLETLRDAPGLSSTLHIWSGRGRVSMSSGGGTVRGGHPIASPYATHGTWVSLTVDGE